MEHARTRTPRWIRATGLALVCAWALLLAAFGAAPKEYEVKAAFLFNFAKFITWPESAFATPEAPLVVGVLGEDPFGELLETALKDKKCGKRAIALERYASLEALRNPHVLFVSNSLRSSHEAIVQALRERPVFLVGDGEGFAEAGATANFFLEKNNVRFAINGEAARRAGLQVSAQLLKLAKVVR